MTDDLQCAFEWVKERFPELFWRGGEKPLTVVYNKEGCVSILILRGSIITTVWTTFLDEDGYYNLKLND